MRPSARLTAVVAIVAAAGVSLALNWPGHFSYDSVVQLAEGRTGVYEGGHPPIMSWLLGVADAARPGAALFVVFDTVLIAGALASFVALGRGVSWWLAPLALAFAAFPQLLIYPSIVWKDVLFAGAATAGFACLAHAAAGWATPARRIALLAAAALLLALATLARQNGVLVLPFAAAAVGWIGVRQGGPAKRGRAAAYALVVLLAPAVMALGVTAALSTRGEPGSSAPGGQWVALQTYDIVNALSLAPATDLPVLRARAPWLETLLRTDGVAAYSPVKADTLEPLLDRAGVHPQTAGLIAAQWKDLIARHPILYLRARARTFQWVFLTPDPENCLLVFTGVGGPDEEMADSGLRPRRTDLDDSLGEYALAFAATPVYSHAAYGALGLVLLVVLMIRRRAPDIAVAAMLGAALAFTASFAVISVACDYRYLYDLDLAVIAAALHAAATWRGAAGAAPHDRRSP